MTDAPGTMITGSPAVAKATSSPKVAKVVILSKEKETPTPEAEEGKIDGGISQEGEGEKGKISRNVLYAIAGGVGIILAYIIYRRKK